MTKREQLLEHIRIDVAKHGRVTMKATRLFIENRISKAAFDTAVHQGYKQYKNGTMDLVVELNGG